MLLIVYLTWSMLIFYAYSLLCLSVHFRKQTQRMQERRRTKVYINSGEISHFQKDYSFASVTCNKLFEHISERIARFKNYLFLSHSVQRLRYILLGMNKQKLMPSNNLSVYDEMSFISIKFPAIFWQNACLELN